MKLSKIYVYLAFVYRLICIDLNLTSNTYFLFPLSIFRDKWLLKKKNGPFAKVVLRRGTTDWFVFKQIFFNEDYCLSRLGRWEEIHQEYKDILAAKKIPLIIDCGANIGLGSLYFSHVFPQAVIVAVEPEIENYKMLVKNTKGLKIVVLHAAISNKNGSVSLINTKSGSDAFRTVAVDKIGSDSVPCFSVQSLMGQAKAFGSSRPFIIKIDIEGFENTLFASNTNWVRLFRVLIIELHDWLLPKKRNSKNFLKVISQENRDFIYIGENVFSVDNSLPWKFSKKDRVKVK